ncbi:MULTISPECIES: glycosyltransferase family 4 protein [Halorussus]|uniref:glycosyltransferase family 4 protein n=1 Tax=Halorussus TaxID=1070314 RepID=UPI0020A029C5|nr:glycosyltransferase family 4 protein [Halorussus vallis]USZ78219.1 glycosyltransferase family 4 protein [Halorussus vallis]
MSDEHTEFVLVTEYFHPDTASTGQLMMDLAVGLRERGLAISVYTGQPNYHSGDNERQPRTSFHEGVRIERIRAPQVRQSSLPRRLFNWSVFTIWTFFVLLFDEAPEDREVIFVSITPLLPIAVSLACWIRGWEYTYVAYDLYPDQATELGYLKEGGLLDRLWSRLTVASYRRAKHIVSNGPLMSERIQRNADYRLDADKIRLIHNWADEEFITPMAKEDNWFCEQHDLTDSFTVLYSGNIGEFHDLKTLVEASTRFEDEDVRFLIIGEGDNKETIVSLAERYGVRGDSVRFLPYQDWEDLPYSLTAGDVSVVAVREGFEGVCVSSKLYTAMAAGRPVLVVAQPYDDESKLVEKFDAGHHVAQGDVDALVDTVRRWRENPALASRQGENARAAFEEHFTKDAAVDEYYRMLAGEPSPRRRVAPESSGRA